MLLRLEEEVCFRSSLKTDPYQSVLKENPDLSKKDLCFWVARNNEEKAHDLLHRVLKERMRAWWD